VDPGITELLRSLQLRADLNITISKVVIEELFLKRLPKCQTVLNETRKKLRDLQSLMGNQYGISLPTQEELKTKIRARLNEWITALKIDVLGIPSGINWEAIFWKAVNRERPFSPASDTKSSNEKGFKDVVILETLLDLYKKEKEREVVFVCDDGLLLKTARELLHDQPRFSAVNALTEFSAQLEVILTTSGLKFLNAAVSKANKEFFDPDSNCIWLRLGVSDQISKSLGLVPPSPMGGPRRVIRLPPRTGHMMDVFRPRQAVEASKEVHRVRETKRLRTTVASNFIAGRAW